MSNVDVVQGIYDAFGKGDVPPILAVLDENIDWREPESLPFEDQSNPQDVAENIFAVVVTRIANFSVNVTELVDAGDYVFGIGTYRGDNLNSDFVHVWRLRDGKVVYFRTYSDTHLWLKALGEI